MSSKPPLHVFAPAKINLFLHVTGKRDDGYHTLDSLVCFADIGDQIIIEDHDELSFTLSGPFARSFTAQEKDVSRNAQNLIIKSVWALSDALKIAPNIRISLRKNLPLGGGIGGGSSNAAATIWALLKWWNITPTPAFLPELLLNIGADVPVCYACRASRMEGIGEDISDAPRGIPELPILLVNPARPSSTHNIFSAFDHNDIEQRANMPETFENRTDFIDFLSQTKNSLKPSAIQSIPDIQNVLDALNDQDEVLLSRMSGSGSTCFGLFPDMQSAQMAAENIMIANPTWWVRSGTINTPNRY